MTRKTITRDTVCGWIMEKCHSGMLWDSGTGTGTWGVPTYPPSSPWVSIPSDHPTDKPSYFTIYNPLTVKEEPMTKKDKYVVVNMGSGSIVARHETEQDAVECATGRANRDDGEYMVFQATKLVRPKPVDIEVVPI